MLIDTFEYPPDRKSTNFLTQESQFIRMLTVSAKCGTGHMSTACKTLIIKISLIRMLGNATTVEDM